MLPERFFLRFLLVFIFSSASLGWATDKVTRVYLLKNVEVSNMSRVLNVVIRDTAGTRVIGGQGKRLVITDTSAQQESIALLLPVLDQPMKETDPDKIQMRMMMNASQYFRQQKIAGLRQTSGGAASPQTTPRSVPATSAANMTGGAKSYDTVTAAKPYMSIYASDDAELLKKTRAFYDEPALPALSALQLKGIFRANSESPLALMAYEGKTYTARDGGLFEYNHKRVKDVTSRVLRDRVILVGPDRIPREIKFRSTL